MKIPFRRFLPLVVPLMVVLAGFSELVRHPGWIIADDRQPILDHAAPPGTRGLGNDLTSIWLPKMVWDLRDRASRGAFDLSAWDPSGFAGRPAAGNPQSTRCYPPYWLALAWGRPAVLGWLTVAHLILGGAGLAVLLGRFGVGVVAASIAGGYYACSPFLIAHTFEGHYPHVWAACWYPWAFVALRGWVSGDKSGGLWLSLVLALTYLTGHPQEWYLLLVFVGVVLACDGFRRWQTTSASVAAGRLLGATGLIVLSLMLCAAALVPHLAAQSWAISSPGVSARGGTRYYVHSIQLLQLLTPFALGGPHDYFGHDNYWETLLSIGLIPLILALLGGARHPSRGLRRGLIGLVAITVVLAGGQRLGLYAVAVKVVPGMGRFRVPARSLFLANVGAAMLAGLGLDVLRGSLLTAERWLVVRSRIRRGAVVLAAVMALAWGVSRPESALRPPADAEGVARWAARGGQTVDRIGTDTVVWGTVLALLTASFAAGLMPASSRRLGLALGLIGLAEVTWLAHRVIVVAPVSAFRSSEPVAKWISDSLARDGRHARVAASSLGLTDLDAAIMGIEKTNLDDSFQIQHSARLYERLYPFLEEARRRRRTEMPMDGAVAAFRAEQARAMARRLGVVYLVTRRGSPLADGAQIRRVESPQDAIEVEQIIDPMPRCYVVPSAFSAPERWETVPGYLGRLDPRQGVVLPKAPPFGGLRQNAREATIVSYEPDRIEVDVESWGSGFLVVGNTWMPGWTAQVNGRREEVMRGDEWLQVVPLRAAGRQRVVLEYRAPGRAAGIVLSVLGGVTWLGLLAPGLRRGFRQRPVSVAIRCV